MKFKWNIQRPIAKVIPISGMQLTMSQCELMEQVSQKRSNIIRFQTDRSEDCVRFGHCCSPAHGTEPGTYSHSVTICYSNTESSFKTRLSATVEFSHSWIQGKHDQLGYPCKGLFSPDSLFQLWKISLNEGDTDSSLQGKKQVHTSKRTYLGTNCNRYTQIFISMQKI